MTTWKAFKLSAEEKFKKEHAKEVLTSHTQGVTGFPVKFELGLSPAMNSLDSALKSKKQADIVKYTKKVKEAVDKYQERIDKSETKKILGGAWADLDKGLEAVRKAYNIK
jgi:hypothetical protein